MAWFKGTATDYQDMLDILKNLVQDDHISAAAVYDGGTGYAIGDTITLSGGTKYHEPEIEVLSINSGDYISGVTVSAGGTGYVVGDKLYPAAGTYDVTPELEVTSVSGGVVTGVQVNNPGICSAQPSNPVATTSDGSGTGCTLNLTFTAGTGIITGVHISDSGVYTTQATNPVSQNTTSGSGTGAKFELTYTDTAWETKVDWEAYEGTAVSIQTAGSGYVAGDLVTVVGGSSMYPCVVKVDTVSGGVPTSVSINVVGQYKTTPSNPAATSGGTGSGLIVTMTWDVAAAEYKYLMIHNTNSDQYLGWRAFKDVGAETSYLWECNGFTGFSSDLMPWDTHPGSLGYPETYVPLSGGASPATIYYWIAINDDRIAAAFKVSSVYPNMYMGGIDRYLTSSEYAYPQVILGCLSDEHPYTYSGHDYAGMTNPGTYATGNEGPGYLRDPDGSLLKIQNWYINGGVPYYFDSYVKIAPVGGTDWDAPSDDNGWYISTYLNWRALFDVAVSIPATFDDLGRVNDDYVLIPAILSHLSECRIYGNLQGIFTFNPDGAIDSEDRIYIGSDVFRCFQNCNKTNRNYFFCIKEE